MSFAVSSACLQQRRVVLAVAHLVVEDEIGVVRHHSAQADAVAGVGDVGRHPLVQRLGDFTRLLARACDLVGELADARRDRGLRRSAGAVDLGDVAVGREGRIHQARLVLEAEHRPGFVRHQRLPVLEAPVAQAAFANHFVAHLLHLPRLGPDRQLRRGVEADVDLAVVVLEGERLDLGELSIEHRLRTGQPVLEHHRVAHGELGEHHRHGGAVGEHRTALGVSAVGLDLVVRLGHRQAPAVRLQRVSLQHVGFLDAGAVADRSVLDVLQRFGLEHLDRLFARLGEGAVGLDDVGHVQAFDLRRTLAFRLDRLRRHRRRARERPRGREGQRTCLLQHGFPCSGESVTVGAMLAARGGREQAVFAPPHFHGRPPTRLRTSSGPRSPLRRP